MSAPSHANEHTASDAMVERRLAASGQRLFDVDRPLTEEISPADTEPRHQAQELAAVAHARASTACRDAADKADNGRARRWGSQRPGSGGIDRQGSGRRTDRVFLRAGGGAAYLSVQRSRDDLMAPVDGYPTNDIPRITR